MIQRLITSLIAVIIIIAVTVFISPSLFDLPALFAGIIAGLVLNYEFMQLVNEKDHIKYPFFIIGIMMTMAIVLSYAYSMNIIDLSLLMTMHCIFFGAFFYYRVSVEMLQTSDYSIHFENISFYLLSYITLVICFPQLLIIHMIYTNSWGLIILCIFCWMSDAFGLFVGSAFGKHPLKMLPSQSKTIEGYIGSFVFTTLLGVLFYYLQGVLHLPFQWTLHKWAFFGIVMSISANFGDLTESLIKRWANKKDSGDFLPGIGGLFDAIDCLIYAVPIALIFFSL